VSFRRSHPSLRRRRWFEGQLRGRVDIDWFRPDGEQMTDEDWHADFVRSVGIFLDGDAIAGRDARGERVTDDSFALLFNAHHEPIEWTLPARYAKSWVRELDTGSPLAGEGEESAVGPDDTVTCQGRAVVVLRASSPGDGAAADAQPADGTDDGGADERPEPTPGDGAAGGGGDGNGGSSAVHAKQAPRRGTGRRSRS
jgi:isoamylase